MEHFSERIRFESIADKPQASGAKLLLHTMKTMVNFSAGVSRADLPHYVSIIRDLAERRGLPLVDHFAHWTRTRTGRNDVLLLLNGGRGKLMDPRVGSHLRRTDRHCFSTACPDETRRNGRIAGS